MSDQQPPQTKDEQIAAVAEYIIAGMRRAAIAGYVRQDGWTVSRDELDQIIVEAEAQILADGQMECPGCDYSTALAIAQIREVLAMSLRSGDPAGAMAARKELNKVSGLTGKSPPPARFSVLPTLDAAQADLLRMLEGDNATHVKAIEAGEADTSTSSGPACPVPSNRGSRRRRKVPASRRDPE